MYKKMTTLFMALCMIFTCCISPAMAADNEINHSEEMTLAPSNLSGTPDASTFGFGGPAPYVTKIEDRGLVELPNGNLGLILRVTGYGRDWAYFDGVAIKSEEIGYFINLWHHGGRFRLSI